MKVLNRAVAIMVLAMAPALASAATITQSLVANGGGTFTFNAYNGPDILTNAALSYNLNFADNFSVSGCKLFKDCKPSLASLEISGSGAFSGLSESATQKVGIKNNTNALQYGSYDLALAGSFIPTSLLAFLGSSGAVGNIAVMSQYQGYPGAQKPLTGTLDLTYTTEVSAVPLPASFPLLLAAMGGIGFAARRRKAKTVS